MGAEPIEILRRDPDLAAGIEPEELEKAASVCRLSYLRRLERLPITTAQQVDAAIAAADVEASASEE